MANPAKDLLCHSAKKAKVQSENFTQNQPDTIRSLTLTHRRYIAPGRTRLQGGGGRSQSPEKNYLPILGTEHLQKVFFFSSPIPVTDNHEFFIET